MSIDELKDKIMLLKLKQLTDGFSENRQRELEKLCEEYKNRTTN